MTNLKEIVGKLSKEAKFEKKILNVRYQKSVAKTVRLKAIEIVRFSKKKMHLEILRKFDHTFRQSKNLLSLLQAQLQPTLAPLAALTL